MVEFGFAVPASLHEIPVSVRVQTAEQVEALGTVDNGGGSHGGAVVLYFHSFDLKTQVERLEKTVLPLM